MLHALSYGLTRLRLCVNRLSWVQAVGWRGRHHFAGWAGTFGFGTSARSVSGIRERVAVGVSTVFAALWFRGRAALGVSRC
jgi:tellurite resistance protein TehA-like permease